MRKIIPLLFLLAGVCFSLHADLNLPSPAAWINFENGTSENATLITGNGEEYTETATINGITCRKIPQGKFMYIQCGKSAIPASERNLLVAITYWDNNNNSIWFNYNAAGNNYQGADFQKNNSQGWATTIITITDGEFSGTMPGESDFRLGHGDSDNYIREIRIMKGYFDPDREQIPEQKNLSSNQFKGKSFTGYQIWQEAGPNDSDWVHWSYGHVPGTGFHLHGGIDVSSFPDLSEFDDSNLYPTNLGQLGNGRRTGLYNAKDAVIINKHMEWLQKADMDGVAVQRFVGPIGKSITLSEKSHLTNVKDACEATGRLFYICYDLNGTDESILERMKKDWVYEIEQIRSLTSSPNYATVNGKPVVEMWGVGYEMATSEQCAALIDFFRFRGCYVIGGTPRDWRTNPGNGFVNVYTQLDCISPWTIGVYGNIDDANKYKEEYMIPDKAYCEANGVDYLPVVFAGSANWLNDNMELSQTFRKGGEFFWTQIQNAKSLDLNGVYYAMLDEFEESTNFIKGAVDYFDIPVDQYFETFSRDGIWVSSDYYMRLAGYAAKMLRNEVSYSAEIPIPYSEGPVYYRNSFESKLSTINKNGSSKGEGEGPDYEIILPVDPCFYQPQKLAHEYVNNEECTILQTDINKSGDYAVKFSGNPSSSQTSIYYYKIAETKIPVTENMQLNFWKYTANELGRYASVDLTFASGKTLRDLSQYTDQTGNGMHPGNGRGTPGNGWEQFTCTFGQGELLGDIITGILIAYDHPSDNGNFTAYFDDIIIDTNTTILRATSKVSENKVQAANVYSANGEIIINSSQDRSEITLYTVTGQIIYQDITSDRHFTQKAKPGIYRVRIVSNGNTEYYSVMVR
ncbi:MAG: hypothetical protein LUG18_04990 [Candidatus Azobacteroides sp.]|nr:hypothetical protein [Candidatus Azobacteroides sp.]